MATISVDTLGDVINGADGLTSLREAVGAAAPGDTIVFDASLAGGTITLDGNLGVLTITQNVTIDGDVLGGDEAADITISGGGVTQIFDVQSGTLDLDSLTLTGGNGSGGSGGAVNVESGATLDVFASTFTGNSAFSGGAVLSLGTVTIADSTFSGNTALGGGGGSGRGDQ